MVIRKIHPEGSGYTVLNQEPPWKKFYTDNTTRFQISDGLLKTIDFPLKRYVTLDNDTITRFVFVTAASNSFMAGVIDGIASVQKYYPGRSIVFYDLGLTARNKVSE